MDKTVILVTRQGLGATIPADAAFGLEMLDKFFHTLEREALRPAAICFYTEGVKLLVAGSAVEMGLKILQGLGVRIVACQSCVNQYGLQDQIVVGEVKGLLEIAQVMSEADKVITV